MNYLDCLASITDFEETKKILEEKNLIVKNYDNLDLFLVKYDKSKSDMGDKDVRKCRGLILEKNTNKPVCIPPLKSEKLDILNQHDFSKLVVEDFPDGTMINVFKYKDQLMISTRSNIGANCRYYSPKTFKMMFEESIDDETFAKLSNIEEGVSLSFVLQHPENIIVSKYKSPSMVLVHGCFFRKHDELEFRDNDSVNKYIVERGLNKFNVPKRHTLKNFDEIMSIVGKMNQYQQGIVIKYVDKNIYIRSKIRNEYYNYVRELRGNSNNKKYIYLELRKYNGLEEYLKYYIEDSELFESYRLELYNMSSKLFNFYQECFVRKTQEGKRKMYIKDVDFEYRPLVIDLHNIFKADKLKTDKRKVNYYVNNLHSARILFTMNYKNYKNKKTTNTKQTTQTANVSSNTASDSNTNPNPAEANN